MFISNALHFGRLVFLRTKIGPSKSNCLFNPLSFVGFYWPKCCGLEHCISSCGFCLLNDPASGNHCSDVSGCMAGFYSFHPCDCCQHLVSGNLCALSSLSLCFSNFYFQILQMLDVLGYASNADCSRWPVVGKPKLFCIASELTPYFIKILPIIVLCKIFCLTKSPQGFY